MKQAFLLLITLIFFSNCFAQENLVPKQYRLIKEIYGDLNKDGIEEKVAVYNMTNKEDEINGVDREIIIFKKDKVKWAVWHRSTSAVGNSKDGGMMGDPFEDIEIKNGVLSISQSGGSSWKWRHTDKYRYQNNNFELIGYTSTNGRICDYWEDLDFNIMTGKIIFKKEYESCDDTNEQQVIYKRENENFPYRLKKKITLQNRNAEDIKIISPKYKHEIYL